MQPEIRAILTFAVLGICFIILVLYSFRKEF